MFTGHYNCHCIILANHDMNFNFYSLAIALSTCLDNSIMFLSLYKIKTCVCISSLLLPDESTLKTIPETGRI